MNFDQLNLEQWRTEIATFVSETRSELRQLRDALSAQIATGHVRADPTARNINDQLASLERNIADRLGQTSSQLESSPGQSALDGPTPEETNL